MTLLLLLRASTRSCLLNVEPRPFLPETLTSTPSNRPIMRNRLSSSIVCPPTRQRNLALTLGGSRARRFHEARYGALRPGEVRYRIDGYSREGFRLLDKETNSYVVHLGSMLLLADRHEVWRPRLWSDIKKGDWATLLQQVQAMRPTPLLVVGTGKNFEDASAALRGQPNALAGRFQLESGATSDMCALYNMLTDEGRPLIAALVVDA